MYMLTVWNIDNNNIQVGIYGRMTKIKLCVKMGVKQSSPICCSSNIRWRLCPKIWWKFGLLSDVIYREVVCVRCASWITRSFRHYYFSKNVFYTVTWNKMKPKCHQQPFSYIRLLIFVFIAKTKTVFFSNQDWPRWKRQHLIVTVGRRDFTTFTTVSSKSTWTVDGESPNPFSLHILIKLEKAYWYIRLLIFLAAT